METTSVTRRRKLWLLCSALGLAALVVFLVHQSISREVDLALAEAARPPEGLAVEEIPSHRLEQGRARLWSETSRATDGGSLGGGLLIATAGGLVEAGGGAARSSMDSLNGLLDHDLTALAVEGQVAALGTRSGVVSLLEGGQARSLRIDGSRHGAVLDLRWYRSVLYIATADGTLIELRGQRATAILPRVEGGITALAESPEGLLAAGGDGAIYRVAGDRLEVVARVSEGTQRLTALAWHGEDLIAGSATGLLRHDRAGNLEPIRQDLFVTSLLSEAGQLLVGTFDGGVVVFEGSRLAESPRRRLLSGRRVDRLRRVDGQTMAFGPGLAAVLEPGGEPRLIELPRGVASGHLTALAFDGQRRLWVGYFDDGVDVLDASGEVVRHLPEPELARMSSVNALLFDAEARTMLVATSHGLLEVGEAEVRTVTSDDGLIGDSVTAIGLTPEGRVYATSQGVTLAPREGGAMRSVYAFHGLPSNRIYAVAGRAGRLLVGTLGGLAELEGLRVAQIWRAGPGGVAANWCVALAPSAEGVYVGSIGGGVDLLEGERVTPLGPRGERFSVNSGAMLLLDEVLLVGSLERGLLVWDRRERVWRELEQPLPGASVTALTADDEHLYVGTDRGLLRLELEAIER
jgi:hypothetical protein